MNRYRNKLHISIFIFYLTISLIYGNAVKKVINEVVEFPLQIQGYSPEQSDDYVAVAVKAPSGYINKFVPLSRAERVHHMILFGCASLPGSSFFWRGFSTCGFGKNAIIYAWARNAPSFDLPKDVAFAAGEISNGINYFVLQIHYADPFQGNVKDYSGLMIHLTQKAPQYLANVFLFAGANPLPPRLSQYQQNMSCTYTGKTPLHPFAFRVHTHQMGRVVSGYYKHNKKWIEIGRRNPQWPQLFQKIDKDLEINTGDLLAASCRFDTANQDTPTNMGHMGKDEMCNFYMMFYRDIDEQDPFPFGAGCSSQERYNEMLSEYPKEGLQLLPKNEMLEAIAAQSKIRFGVIEREKVSTIDQYELGQISGLAFDNNGNLAVFHRGSRQWNQYSFGYDNTMKDKRPISEPTILILSTNGNEFNLIHALGKNMFYMPHGIFIDESNYIYVTDVGTHQVHKMKINNGKLEIIFSIGEKFVPGSDKEHFCKPSAVAVSKYDGSIYITDGYCNNRVMKFSKNGKFIKQFGMEGKNSEEAYADLGTFNLPHDISIDDKNNKIYVTDRENGRVQVFTPDGEPLYDIKDGNLFNNVYSAHYCPDHGLILIPGVQSGESTSINAYVVPTNSTMIQYGFGPMNDVFKRTHIIRAQGDYVYVGEIAGSRGKLWKFEIESDHLLKTTTLSSEGTTESLSTETSSIKEIPPKSSGGILIFALVSIAILIAGFFGYKTLKVRERDSTTGMNFFDRQSFQPLKTTDDMSDSDDEIGE